MFDAANLAPQSHPINRRSIQRYRAFLHGRLLFDIDDPGVDCLIRNLSQTGARVEIEDNRPRPNHPMLVVTKTGWLHQSTLVWTAPLALGLKFDASVDLNFEGPPAVQRAYRDWVENHTETAIPPPPLSGSFRVRS